MILLTAAERRSRNSVPIVPVRFVPPDPTPISPLPPDLNRYYVRTELCQDCGQVPALRSLYPVEFRHRWISCLLICWACGYGFFKPKSALSLAESVARSLRTNAVDAMSPPFKAGGMTNP